jgi:hypothetical protein
MNTLLLEIPVIETSWHDLQAAVSNCFNNTLAIRPDADAG